MQCPQCDRENPEGAKFCGVCGAELARICAQCGSELPPDPEVRFCFECGTEVQPPAEPPAAEPDTFTERLQRLVPKEYVERLRAAGDRVAGERRTVTILFSDVKGSTAMAEKLDPEEVMEIMNGAFDVLIEPIYRYEGTLARLMGDAILAFFGAPIAHEDDPERACRAALEIIEGAKRYAAKLEDERGISGFDVRVGIHTGLVVVGEVGSDLRVEYTAMGDAINLAARMEGAAEPGTVLITENTHKLVAPLFETESLGPIQVKGKKGRVPVHRVLAARDVPGKVRGVAGLESPLVGREAEFAALREAMDRLQAGVGGIVTIVGEAGLGKSRLMAEARTTVGTTTQSARGSEAEGTPVQWVEGRCLSYGTSTAYQLWMDVLRGLLGVTAEASPEAMRDTLRERVHAMCPERIDDVYRYLGHMMSLPLEAEHEAAVRDLGGEKLRAGTFAAMETLLGCTATEHPLIVVCEDLHWADATSIDLLEHLLSLTDRSSLLFVCVFRPELEHGCWRIKEIATREYPHRHLDLRLQPLSTADSAVLVENLLQVEGVPPVLKERILEHAEGNPLYVEEILRSLVDQDAIFRDEASGRWLAVQDAAEIPIPDTLHGVLLARIDRLREDTKRVLQMAAVIGRVFLCRVLEAVAEEERELDKHLLTLQWEQMIRERARIPELEYIFKHELTREAAYNGLLKKQRRAFHRQVAETLERLFPDRIEEQAGLLAHHWERAGESEQAIHYLQRAGDQARLMYSHAEAIDYYQRALVLLKEQEQHEQAARTLMKLGLTYHTAFRFKESRRAYEEGSALWKQASLSRPAVALPPAPHALRQWWVEPVTLDPNLVADTFSGTVVQHLFSGLVKLSHELDVVPDLAQSWEVLEGGRKYVFHLREDARWSDGVAVTAEDLLFSWKRVLHPATGSKYASLLYDVKGARSFHQGETSDPDTVGVRASGEHTILVELEEPTGYFLQLMACSVAYPVPRHVVEAHGDAWAETGSIVTNGPFQLQAWIADESMTLVRSPEYRGWSTGNLQQVELLFLDITSADPVLERYEADELDIMGLTYLLPTLVERARQSHADEYMLGPDLATSFIGFNTRQSPFDDLLVRRAFALSSDREKLAHVAYMGQCAPALGGFVPQGMPGHSAEIGLPYDPERARQLLAEAGYADGRGFPSVECVALLVATPATQYLRTQWQNTLGVRIEWTILRWEAFLERIGGAEPPQMWLQTWAADYPDPDNFVRVGFPWGATGWRNDDYDILVDKARRVMDQEERMRLYRQADRILVQEAAIVPLVYARRQRLVKPWVRKFPTSAIQWAAWEDVIIEPH